MTESTEKRNNALVRPFHLMCKPSGPDCNLNCKYCFYTEKQTMMGADKATHMTDEVLEDYVRKYIAANPAPEINFSWQGGEPTLMGLDFFRRAIELQKRYSDGRTISNSLQTNGILLDDAWCEFLAKEKFLVGLSIDGPRHIHDKYRIDRGGNPSFDRVFASMKRLLEYKVEFNTLTCVTADSAEKPLDVYRFLKENGSGFMQFIPIVERMPNEQDREIGLRLAEPFPGKKQSESGLMPWSVAPEAYGRFLNTIFDEWVQSDVGRVFVQIFDIALAAWNGMEPPLCNFSRMCGNAMVIEHNGDVYSCDHFVYPDHLLGNVQKDDIRDMVNHPRVRTLGENKQKKLPRKCRQCDVLFACNGGCPKNRFAKTSSGEPGLNYLCEGYRMFFHHIDPAMKKMVGLLRQNLAPALIMEEDKRQTGGGPKTVTSRAKTGRNEPCPCGSGKKYKHCCG